MSRRVKNVFVLSDIAGVGGGASQIALLTARILRDRGYNVVFFAGFGEGGSAFDGIRVEVVHERPFLEWESKAKGALEGLHSRRTYDKLRAVLSEYSPKDTVLHIHGWTHALSSSIFDAIADGGFRSVVTVHEYFLACPNGGFFDYRSNRICRLTPCSASCLVRNCDKRSYAQKLYRVARLLRQNRSIKRARPALRYLSPFTYGWLKGNVLDDGAPQYLPNPIDAKDKLGTVPIEKREGYLFVGRMDPEKNPGLFCEALTRMGLSGTLCGDGPLLAKLKEKYPNLIFLGWCDKDELDRHFRANKALVLTSNWLEASPLSCLEAMFASGIPSIIPNTCGATSYIEDGKTGLWFENGSLESLCEAIERMEDLGFYRRICAHIEEALPALREDRSFDTYAERLIELYEGLYE